MRDYRLYRLDGAGNILSAEWLREPDDDSAVRPVTDLRLHGPAELWRGQRLVARIEPASDY
ncbi:hypothetical protein H8M03_03695 [Sphingomonas sabuli]|uniref:Uncharacterized protein n=1 Tax=Sphingomonas sabuli TaxID=2764186 RepID=A0A7G9L4A0_9SPHN|nr:hypothetical protein [Sphingomonas sabuli]QNM83449.1 hypothetical protein H8M03_03695 [Sphingomonas sabuli]